MIVSIPNRNFYPSELERLIKAFEIAEKTNNENRLTYELPSIDGEYGELDDYVEIVEKRDLARIGILSNGEIVNIQMDRFETSLETAIRAKTQRIVFIHGVGNGKLKHELRKTLERKYPDLKYQDASFKEYGYGATMVYLK